MLIRKGHPDKFDATVAIFRGGSLVCQSLCHNLPEEYLGHWSTVMLQRPSTKKKDGLIGKILPYFPIPILNLMRLVESSILNLRHKIKRDVILPEVSLGCKLRELLCTHSSPEILVVDDAVDSGITLAAVYRSIHEINPKAKVTSAVITVTTSQPEINPDFSIYSNHTLIRFPWSKDFPR